LGIEYWIGLGWTELKRYLGEQSMGREGPYLQRETGQVSAEPVKVSVAFSFGNDEDRQL
jgi:hypothetical protein